MREGEHPRENFLITDVIYLSAVPSIREENHFVAFGYANAWYIDPRELDVNKDGKFTLVLYFWPQSLFYLGIIISIISFVIAATITCYKSFKGLHRSEQRLWGES